MIFRYFPLVTLIALALSAPNTLRHGPRLGARIVGGHDIEIEEAPWQISLEWDGSHICGGSIISEKYVLTATHCTEGLNSSKLRVRAGTSIAEEGGSLVSVTKINRHPLYDYMYYDYDISVLELAESLELGSKIATIGLPDAEAADGTAVNVTGWGATSEYGPLPAQLQLVEVNMVNRDECQEGYLLVTDRMICAGVPEGGKDACGSDSGGPLYQDGLLYGVFSWGYGCGEKGYPGVYGNVANFEMRSFIKEITGL